MRDTDPRLDALASRTERWFANRKRDRKPGAGLAPDLKIAQLIAALAGVSSPGWDRLQELAKKREEGTSKGSARR
jgi:hypothetical protein